MALLSSSGQVERPSQNKKNIRAFASSHGRYDNLEKNRKTTGIGTLLRQTL
jgi:hypothetical protein